MNRIFLQQDSRDIHFPVGAVPIIPDSIEFDRGISNVVESPASVECTAISAADVCANQTGVVYSYDDLWSWTPHTEEGATPQDSMGALIKHGLLPVSNDVRDARWKSYFRAEGNSGDYFETTRVSMMSAQSPTTCATNFYSEWLNVPDDGVLPIGQTRISGHDWSVTGWRTTPIGLQFHVKFWTGGFRWMPKEVFNNEMHKYGTTAFIPTSQTVLYNSTRTLIQWIKDFCVNIGLSLKQNNVSLPPNPTPMIHTFTKIEQWANAIKIAEGNAPFLNNPGSLKVSTLTQSWGAKNGVQATDGGWIAKFDTFALGYTALCNFLTLGAQDELKAFHQARTLESFTKIYAGNPPQGYIDTIVKELGVSPTVDISSFLS